MHVALIIGGSLVAVGLVLYIHHRLTGGSRDTASRIREADAQPAPAEDNIDGECCGMHITCERDSLSPVFAGPAEYFDDEELDVFSGRGADSYTDDEIEQFRDVLLSLIPDDIAPWARSIQQRGIQLPPVVRDELFMLVNEERARRAKQ